MKKIDLIKVAIYHIIIKTKNFKKLVKQITIGFNYNCIC